MFDFIPNQAQTKPQLYRDLIAAADALTAGESDGIANMANVAALLWEYLPDCNWTGFYRMIDDELVLGPFCGRPACIRIPMGQGVCGTAAATANCQLVPDVYAFPGHIVCDGETRSELVVPVIREDGRGERSVIAVIDCDSPLVNRFDNEDRTGLEDLARILSMRI